MIRLQDAVFKRGALQYDMQKRCSQSVSYDEDALLAQYQYISKLRLSQSSRGNACLPMIRSAMRLSKKRDCHSGYNAQKVLLVLSGDEIKIPAKVSIAVLN